MHKTKICILAIAIASATVVGCGGGDTGPDSGTDGGPSTADTGGRDAFASPDTGTHDGGHDAGTDASSSCTGADLCTTAGPSCSGNTLVTCAAAADGCLRSTSSDCTTSHMVCDQTGGTAVCADPCAHIPVADRCTSASRACTGGTLDVCAMDAMGCYAITHTDCTTAAGGACDTSGSMPVCVSTADPCGGLTSCGAAASTCTDTTHVSVCAANPAGCNVSTTTTCGASQLCHVSASGAAMCVSACSLVTTCPSANYCAGNDAIVCGFDANSCLVERSRTTCANTCNAGACVPFACGNGALDASETCDDGNMVSGDGCSATCVTESGYNCTGTPSVCTASAANATCATATAVTATRTITGEDTHGGGTSPSGAGCTTAAGATLFYAVTVPAFTGVRVDVAPDAMIDPVIRVQDSCAATTCTSRTDSGNAGAPETFTVNNVTASPITRIVEVDGYFAATPGVYSVTFTYIAATCGNGMTGPGENCDDGNMANGDGCSSTCAVEPGYGCTTAAPSVCTLTCGNGTVNTGETCDDGNRTAGDGCSAVCQTEAGYVCSGTPSVCVVGAPNANCSTATVVTATRTITGEDTHGGGTSPSGTGCTTAAGATLFYALTVPANTGVRIDVTPDAVIDPVIRIQDSCSATACTSRTDSGNAGDPETFTVNNMTASPITQIVEVDGYSAATPGTYTVAFTYFAFVCGNGVVTAGETCDDGNTAAGDGCSATCTIETGYSCSGTPSSCIHVPVFTSITAACADLSAATPLSISSTDDAVTATTALPFAFSFFGTPQMSYSVSTNGNLQVFPTATGTATDEWTNTTIPDMSTPNGYIAPFWDDITGASLRTTVTGTAPNRVLVVEWRGTGPATIRFQAMLYETTSVIEYHYCAMGASGAGAGSSATIGVENITGAYGTQISYNTPLSATTGSGYRLVP